MEDFETGNAEDATLRQSGPTGAQETEGARPVESALFVPGSLFLGKYNIQDRIGLGGMGVVYRCSQVFIGRDLAIKTLNQGSMSDEAVQRFQTEAKAAGSLNHPNIVSVHDFGVTDGGTPYMVMDFVPGKTLQDVLTVHGQLSLETVIDILIQCADALAHAHGKGVFHRDIKPSNIVLLQEESIGPGAIRILDFGIAKISSSGAQTQELTKTGMVIGSPLYMSPEQSLGRKMDARTDIYSLGCVLYECLCGVPPFQGDTIIETLMLHQTEQPKTLREASMGREFPPQLQELVSLMMAKSVEDRIESMGTVHQILLSIKDALRSAEKKEAALAEQQKDTLAERRKSFIASVRSLLLNTKLIIALVATVVLAVAGVVITQLEPQKEVKSIKPIPLLDGGLATPEIEQASYDQKIKRALTESRSRGWEHTSIPSCEFSQSQFKLLASAKWLKRLTLVECSRFTPEGIKTLLSGNIEVLDLRGSELNEQSVEAVAKYGSNLRNLSLSKCTNVSPKAIKALAQLKKLEYLDLSTLPVSDDVLKVIVDGIPHMKELSLTDIPYIGDNSARILARPKRNWGFGLSNTSISDEGLKYFGKNIHWLYLSGNPRITDKGIETLIANCPEIKILQIPGTSVTPRAILKVLQMKSLNTLQIGSMDIDNATRERVRETAKSRGINIYDF